jgi:hypothetical protein
MFVRELMADVRSRLRLLAVVALGFVLMLPAVNLFSVLFGGGSELSYSFSLVASTCRQIRAPCLTYAELDIGNTGSRWQDLIEIELGDQLRWSGVDHYSVKIVASNEPFVPPVVLADTGQQRIAVRGLAENQMITFQFVIPGRVTRDEFRETEPTIRAAGRVIESSPKATALARAFRTAFAFLL